MTQDELTAAVTALREAESKMTPGEWTADDEGWCAFTLNDEGEPVWLFEVQGEKLANHEQDLHGLVALRNTALPVIDALLATVAELRGQLAESELTRGRMMETLIPTQEPTNG